MKKDRKTKKVAISPASIRQQKRSQLKKIYGMWKNRKPDPIKELEKMR